MMKGRGLLYIGERRMGGEKSKAKHEELNWRAVCFYIKVKDLETQSKTWIYLKLEYQPLIA